MKNITLLVGAIYTLMSVVLGAFGSHAFKKILAADRLISFEVGVRYQMYAGLILLFMGCFFKFEQSLQKWISILMIVGSFVFSVSIYVLSFQDFFGVNLRLLAPITPIGGAMIIVSLSLLVYSFLRLF